MGYQWQPTRQDYDDLHASRDRLYEQSRQEWQHRRALAQANREYQSELCEQIGRLAQALDALLNPTITRHILEGDRRIGPDLRLYVELARHWLDYQRCRRIAGQHPELVEITNPLARHHRGQMAIILAQHRRLRRARREQDAQVDPA